MENTCFCLNATGEKHKIKKTLIFGFGNIPKIKVFSP